MSGAAVVAEQVRVAALRPQVVLDRHPVADRQRRRDRRRARPRRPGTAPLRWASRASRTVSAGAAAPAERARDQHVQVARAAHRHRRGRPWPPGRAARRRSPSRRRGCRAPSRCAAGPCRCRTRLPGSAPTGLGGRGARGRRGRAGALHAGVHVGLVVVADVEHVVVALEHARTGTRGRCRRCRRRRPGRAPGCRRGPVARSAAATPEATDARVGEQRVQPRQLPRALRERGREHLEAAGRVDGDQPAVGGAHRGVEHVARGQRLAAALAGAVPGVERVAPVRVGLLGALGRGRAAGCRPRGCRPDRTSRRSSRARPIRSARPRAPGSRRPARCAAACCRSSSRSTTSCVEVEEAQARRASPRAARREHRAQRRPW